MEKDLQNRVMKSVCKNARNIHIVSVPDLFLNMRLKDAYCKHVLSLTSIAKALRRESFRTGYEYCQWGSHEGDEGKLDLYYHARKIVKMEEDGYEHAVRIVICKYPFSDILTIWVDNLHSAILQIRKKGLDVMLKEIPFYIVDISDYDNPIIMSHNGSFIDTDDNREGVLYCAYKRYERSNNGKLISLNYRVKDFICDNYELYTFCNKTLKSRKG